MHPLTDRRFDVACEVDLPVQRCQQLNGLQPAVVFCDAAPVANEFVRQVFESVSELFETTPGLLSDLAPDRALTTKNRTLVKRLHAE